MFQNIFSDAFVYLPQVTLNIKGKKGQNVMSIGFFMKFEHMYNVQLLV